MNPGDYPLDQCRQGVRGDEHGGSPGHPVPPAELPALPPSRLIDASEPGLRGYWHELCAFREVAYMLIRRDLIVRFRQTYFGLAWLLFKPLMLMAVMSFAFGYLAGFQDRQSAPYPLMIFVA